MSEHQIAIVYPWNIAKEFPELPSSGLIDRSNFIQTIQQMFNEASVVFLEGEEGYGATTTAALFCLSNSSSCFSLFIKPVSKIAYSADYLRLVLAEQFYWFLDHKEYDKDVIDPSEYNHLLVRVRRKATRQHPIYFVVDGLHQIGAEDVQSVEMILRDLLPIGWDYIKFLIVGKQENFERYINRVPSKYYHQLKFSLSDSREFLKELNLSDEEQTSIHALCDGVPGRLASVKRLLKNGISLQEILLSEPSKYLEFVKLEFAKVAKLPVEIKRLLAAITFANRQLDVSELLTLTKMPEDKLTTLKAACPFIAVIASSNTVEFVSEGHRNFAAHLLDEFRNDALAAQIEHLVLNPSSPIALRFLPTYYQQLGQTQELLRLLSTDHFSQLLETTESINSLRSRAELGVKSAVLLKQAADVFRFSVNRSIFSSIADAEGMRSEIQALVALGEEKTALALANESVVKEERLAFLCAYARQIKETLKNVDFEVITFIRQIAETINFAELGNKAIDIASDLVLVDPELAMSIVQNAVKGAGNFSDQAIALARVTLAARKSGSEAERNEFNEVQSHITDENLQKFVSSVIALVSDLSIAEVIMVAETIDDTRRLSFLCHWVKDHKKSKDALDIVEHALNYMISNTAYTPKMHDLRDLAVALPFAKDQKRIEALIQRFDSQKGIIQDTSVTADLIALQMTLAYAEMQFDQSLATNRIIDAYYQLAGIEDAETKLECFAIMLEALCLLDEHETLEREHEFKALCSNDLQLLLNNVLENSADHFLIVKGALRSLSKADLQAAVNIAERLNTEERRDLAYAEIAKSVYGSEVDAGSVTKCLDILPKIINKPLREAQICRFVNALSLRKCVLDSKDIIALSKVVLMLESSEFRCSALVELINIHIASNDLDFSLEVTEFNNSLNLLNAVWNKADLCFSMSSAIAKADFNLARKFYDQGVAFKSDIPLGTQSFAQIIATCLSLTARAFGGGLKAKCLDDDELARFIRLVELVPSTTAKIDLFSALASRAWCAQREDVALRILRQYCLPIIDETLRANPYLGAYLVRLVFPALFCVQQQIALDHVKNISQFSLEYAVTEAIDLILTKSTKADPALDDVREKFPITYDDAKNICTLIGLLNTDSEIFYAVNQLCLTIRSKVNKRNFTINQREDIAAKLGDIFHRKLPDLKNIKHEGYLILCEASLLALKENVSYADWEALVKRGRNVANFADRGYILQEIAEILPKKFNALLIELKKEAYTLFMSVPSPIDRVNRLIGMSEQSPSGNLVNVKKVLKSAMEMTLDISDEELAKKSRKRIIEIADKVDTEFSDELIDLLDTDPVRAHARTEVKQRLKMLELKKKLANTKDEEEISKTELQHLPEAAWRNLAALMSNRLETKSPDLLITYLQNSSLMPLEKALPVLAWYVENSIRKFAQSPNKNSQVRPMVESMLLASELTMNLLGRINTRKSKYPLEDNKDRSPTLGINNREAALAFISNWLGDCENEILLCDPFFGPEELEFLRMVLANCPACSVTILTSKRHLSEKGAMTDDAFLSRWAEMMDQDPPATKIIAVSHLDGVKSVIHDRWLISGKRGLGLGTSIGSVGTGKLSAISELDDKQTEAVSDELRRFVLGERTIDGVKVSYVAFTF